MVLQTHVSRAWASVLLAERKQHAAVAVSIDVRFAHAPARQLQLLRVALCKQVASG